MECGEFAFEEMSDACMLFHKFIRADKGMEKKIECVEIDSPIDNYHRIDAGNKHFATHDFQFNSDDQREFINMVLLNNRKLVGLQAATSFGKSMSFILPMMVLKEHSKVHYIHFCCVPYESLKVATIKKLEKGGLIARDMVFFVNDNGGTETSVEVFVGCLETFKDGLVGHKIANWESSCYSRCKLGYLVFDEAHTLFLEARFRRVVGSIKNLSWNKWKMIVLLSATMGRDFFKRILNDRYIPTYIVENCKHVNCIREVPDMYMESNVEWVGPKELIKKTVRLLSKFLANTTGSKAIFFFSKKETLHQVYRQIQSCKEVEIVDADGMESRKRLIYNEFENENADVRIVLGTKLLSNGLDCKSIQFICLIDCFINCIDYLQMVGRVRNWGFIKILTVLRKEGIPYNTEISRLFPVMEWNKCISEQIARFYGVQYDGHNSCCGNSNNSPSTKE